MVDTRLFLVAEIDKGDIFTEIGVAVLSAVCNRTLDLAGTC
jgi:hypothetical protein